MLWKYTCPDKRVVRSWVNHGWRKSIGRYGTGFVVGTCIGVTDSVGPLALACKGEFDQWAECVLLSQERVELVSYGQVAGCNSVAIDNWRRLGADARG